MTNLPGALFASLILQRRRHDDDRAELRSDREDLRAARERAQTRR